MKIWKIEHTNKGAEGVKIAISLSSSESRGIILKAGEFVLAQEQPTASLDSQTRRGFVKVEQFDNSQLMLPLGEAFNSSILLSKPEPVVDTPTRTEDEEKEFISKLQEAEKDASDYINNKDQE
jgi:hypothetical protein